MLAFPEATHVALCSASIFLLCSEFFALNISTAELDDLEAEAVWILSYDVARSRNGNGPFLFVA
jgi:hypothetical protein